jgi:cytochrome bd ubiquinol oxidase subunit II
MNSLWFMVLGGLLVGYAILDGLDLGVGSLHLILGKDDTERRNNLNAIGPFWAGYEVWLLTAGGSMVAAFPHLYAAAFSGFYIVLTLVLWLLLARGGAIEFRSHIASPLWRDFWDVVFSVSSALLAILFGAAVGNVVRGVALDSTGSFQGSLEAALNPFAILVGVLSLILLSMHGANLVSAKTSGDQSIRAGKIARFLWVVVAVLCVATTVFAMVVRPTVTHNFIRHPVLALLPLFTVAALVAIPILQMRNEFGRAIYAGACLIAGLMGCAGASLYPYLLPELGSTTAGLTIYNAAAPKHTLETAFVAIVVTMTVVIGYHIYIHRVFAGKVTSNAGEQVY